MTEERPDDVFINRLCYVCHKPIGREWGVPLVIVNSETGLVYRDTGEWVHLGECIERRFMCPVTKRNCFEKPDAETPCSRCLASDQSTSTADDVSSMIFSLGDEPDDEVVS